MLLPQYVFIGNGNWDVAANWLTQMIPPTQLPFGAEIIVDPVAEGECVLNVSQYILPGGFITVRPSKKFRIPARLDMK